MFPSYNLFASNLLYPMHSVVPDNFLIIKCSKIISKNGREGIISFAEGDEQRMLLMGLKRFTKYINYPNVVALRNTIAEKLKAENKYCF